MLGEHLLWVEATWFMAPRLLGEVKIQERCPTMKHSVAVALAAITFGLSLSASPALAQNAAQIAKVQAGASCPKCNLFQADLNTRTLKAKNFSGARLRQADLSLGSFNRSRFDGADLRDVNGFGALFSGANFARADLTNANLVGAYLEGANFSGANLSGVILSGAELSTARGLTQAQLDKTCGDKATRLPSGLRIPVCR